MVSAVIEGTKPKMEQVLFTIKFRLISAGGPMILQILLALQSVPENVLL